MEKGALLSPLDERDYRCNTVMEQGEKLPKNFEVWQPPVQNQGFVGNCVAQALSNIKECWLYKRHKTHRDFSVGFIYGWENRSYSGMYSRSALAQMVKIGDCMAADFEANLGIPQICELVEKRREELAAKAAENKSLSYVRLYSKQELMAFIYKYRVPVLITLDAANLDNLLDRESYHALAAYGWRDDGAYIKFTNSWGDAWGEQGKGEIAFAEILEMWGLIETEIIELTDIDGHWAELEIRRTVADGILCGYPDHTFAPDKPLTRAELAVLWTRMKNALKGE